MNATADGGLEATFEADLVLLDGFEDLLGDVLHVPMNVVLLEIDRGVHGVHDLLDGAGDQGSDSVTRVTAWGAPSPVRGM